jgi:hypothetical protein
MPDSLKTGLNEAPNCDRNNDLNEASTACESAYALQNFGGIIWLAVIRIGKQRLQYRRL